MNLRAIHIRLIAWYSGLMIILCVAFGLYTYRSMQWRMEHEITQTFTRRAQQIANSILADTNDKQEIAERINEVYAPAANSKFIRITNASGQRIYRSGAPKDKSFDPDSVPLDQWEIPHRILPTSGAPLFIVPVHSNGYLLEMGIPYKDMQTALNGLRLTLLVGLPLVFALGSLGGYALIGRALKPVEKMRAIAERISYGNLNDRVPVVASGDAIEQLALTLNNMLARLEAAFEQANRFSADASHELRTPLAIMRGELESLLVTNLPDYLRDRLASIMEEAERLSRITEQLFAISRLDGGEAKIAHAPVDLATLARTTTEQMELLAQVKHIRLHVDAPISAPIEGDAARLKQVLVNLLDNAIKYTPEGGKVEVSIVANSRKVILEVEDNGIGIPAENLPHVFERFYRADKSRARESGGAGLGLSIVQAICAAHGVTAEISSTEGSGTKCRIEFPALAIPKEQSHA